MIDAASLRQRMALMADAGHTHVMVSMAEAAALAAAIEVNPIASRRNAGIRRVPVEATCPESQ